VSVTPATPIRTAPDAYARRWLLSELADALEDSFLQELRDEVYALREPDLFDRGAYLTGWREGCRSECERILTREGRPRTTAAEQRDWRQARERQRQAHKKARARR
jgi:hypothetical protein